MSYIKTAFKPAYVETKDLAPADLCKHVRRALTEAGCADVQVDDKANRMLAKALSGGWKIVCWWTAQQEDSVIGGMPTLTIDKNDATMIGIAAAEQTKDAVVASQIEKLVDTIRSSIESEVARQWSSVKPVVNPGAQ